MEKPSTRPRLVAAPVTTPLTVGAALVAGGGTTRLLLLQGADNTQSSSYSSTPGEFAHLATFHHDQWVHCCTNVMGTAELTFIAVHYIALTADHAQQQKFPAQFVLLLLLPLCRNSQSFGN